MGLPLFDATTDPGPDFSALVHRSGISLPGPGPGDADLNLAHATTVVALKFADGVIMAGDRRATAGNVIAHRAMDKVFPADRFSAVAISGSAAMASEMVRLFQVQLEHYEKVEGVALSMEGKANQLAQMVRTNLGMAMQGFVVVPLFCGFDVSRGEGRIFDYDAAGGRYEEADYQTTGSGGTYAKTTIRLGYRDAMTHDDAIELSILSLYEAADADSATGGPDAVRGIYPVVATVTANGYTQLDDADVAARFDALVERRRATHGNAEGTLR
ncbi:MAG TPA: proteasome subunit beta [Acidimicrobiales bacterium]|nr:proteasome subunit beta [Acidimicrobiales bacterium]